MNHWSEYPFVRILFAYIAGIAIYLFTPVRLPVWLVPVLLITAWWCHMMLRHNAHFLYRHAILVGLPFQLAVLVFAAVHTGAGIDSAQPLHYVTQMDSATYFVVKITEPPVEKERSMKVMARIIGYVQGNDVKASNGKIILYLAKDSLPHQIAYGQVMLIKNRLKQVAAPANPEQFDYRQYLWYKEIYATAYLKTNEWQLLPAMKANPLFILTYRLRALSLQAIRAHIASPRETGVAEALVIGLKDHMSPDTLQSYSAAGVVHVLAVSGLHVAILFALLHQLLFFLNRKKHGKILQSVIIVAVIWMFSLVTGLSGSVVRAATMFTFITVGKNMKRPVNLFNLLACSALSILLVNPLLIMDVGFQLSYLAVLGIGTLNRYIDSWLPRENKLIDFLWKMAAMSLAAQIVTLPLTTFYFHQFPTYFLLANLVVIPAAGLLLHLGILLICIQLITPLAAFTGVLIGWITYCMNEFILRVEQLPGSVIFLPEINVMQLTLLGCILFAISRYFITSDKRWAFAFLICFISVAGMHAYDVCTSFSEKSITLYAFRGSSMLAFRSGHSVEFVKHGDTLSNQDSLYLIRQCMLNHIRIDEMNTMQKNQGTSAFPAMNQHRSIYQFGGYRLGFIHGSPAPAISDSTHEVDALVISGNPEGLLNEMIRGFETDTIIFDPTNSTYLINRWKEEANQIGLHTYAVMEEGAFTRKL